MAEEYCHKPHEYEVVLDDEKGKKTTLGELLDEQPMPLDDVTGKLWKFLIENKYLKVKKDENGRRC